MRLATEKAVAEYAAAIEVAREAEAWIWHKRLEAEKAAVEKAAAEEVAGIAEEKRFAAVREMAEKAAARLTE